MRNEFKLASSLARTHEIKCKTTLRFVIIEKPQEEEKEKEGSETDREKTIQWNQLPSKLLYENESDDPMSNRMQNELQYSRLAHNDIKLDNVMQNETIAVPDQAL